MEGDMEQKFWSRGMRIAAIALRITTIVFLLVSCIILLTNSLPLIYRDHTEKVHFYDVLGFKYMFATIILAIGYLAVQTVFAVRSMRKEDHVVNPFLLFFGDKVVTNLIATGAVSGFIATRDKQKWVGEEYSNYESSYFNKSYTAAGLLLLGFFLTSILSAISSHALSKKL